MIKSIGNILGVGRRLIPVGRSKRMGLVLSSASGWLTKSKYDFSADKDKSEGKGKNED